MKITIDNIKDFIGFPIYKAYKFEEPTKRDFIEEGILVNYPTQDQYLIDNENINEWMDVGYNDVLVVYKSLMDAGILPNQYNLHQTFSTRKEAEDYINKNKLLEII